MNITQYSCTHIFIKVKFQETQRLKSCILSILSIHLRLKPNYRKKNQTVSYQKYEYMCDILAIPIDVSIFFLPVKSMLSARF